MRGGVVECGEGTFHSVCRLFQTQDLDIFHRSAAIEAQQDVLDDGVKQLHVHFVDAWDLRGNRVKTKETTKDACTEER